MASLVYNSALYGALTGAIDFDTDVFKCLLVTSLYTPNKSTHTNRSHVTNEVTGSGYSAGGAVVTTSVNNDTVADRQDVTLGAASWPNSTITARGAVYCKILGGAASADEIVAYIDFGSDISSINGTFSLTASILRIQN